MTYRCDPEQINCWNDTHFWRMVYALHAFIQYTSWFVTQSEQNVIDSGYCLDRFIKE